MGQTQDVSLIPCLAKCAESLTLTRRLHSGQVTSLSALTVLDIFSLQSSFSSFLSSVISVEVERERVPSKTRPFIISSGCLNSTSVKGGCFTRVHTLVTSHSRQTTSSSRLNKRSSVQLWRHRLKPSSFPLLSHSRFPSFSSAMASCASSDCFILP